jgi:glutathione synthase/RimK-type ligase-like ATP-grasp enzyme
MKRLIILTDEASNFLISMADLKNYTSMDISKISTYFLAKGYSVEVLKFSELDLTNNYLGVYILYQTAETPGAFYKHYIEDLIYFLEKHGAIVMPNYEELKAHHNKIFMEMMRLKFNDESLKTIKSRCYGSWVDARNYNAEFPVVIKQSSSAGSAGVFLARDKKEYDRKIKKAGHLRIASGLLDFIVDWSKKTVKKIIKYFQPYKSKYLQFDTTPVSRSMVVQTFIEGLNRDCKILVFGNKYYARYRKVRANDFRASGSGLSFDIPDEDYEGLLNFAKKLAREIDFPIIGMDIGFDGKEYHLFEFQMIHIGTYLFHKSGFWHEFHDGKWVRYEGISDLEEEFSRSINDYITATYSQ